MKRSTAATLEDVAREAWVSAMVASVVLNGARSSTRVSEKTRARILEAAARLHYRRNALALGLSRNRIDTIGVAATIDSSDVNLYFLEVLNGILGAAAEHGQSANVFSVFDWQRDQARLLEFCDGRIDGMILIGPHLDAAFAEALAHHTRFVTLHSNSALPNAYNLDVDNERGGYEATRHLLEQGHRRIAHFAANLDLVGAQQRLAGYRRALEEAGIAFEDSLVVPGQFNIDSGRQSMSALLERCASAPLPTAIFCASDAIAYGCMEVLTSHGIRIPDDISVVGFDDTMMARMTRPPLTTVCQPFRQMGRRAVELLLSQIHADEVPAAEENTPSALAAPGDDADSHTVIFAVELVVRESTGPPPKQPIVPVSLSTR